MFSLYMNLNFKLLLTGMTSVENNPSKFLSCGDTILQNKKKLKHHLTIYFFLLDRLNNVVRESVNLFFISASLLPSLGTSTVRTMALNPAFSALFTI